MPAYRSSAEAEIRTAVVEKLRAARPEARIIHEINACFGGSRIDVLAVSPADIVAVEIKSKKDKLDRLPAQIEAMRGVAHCVVAALHEKFCPERESGQWFGEYERGGVNYYRIKPDEAKRSHVVWAYAGVKAEVYRKRNASLYRWNLSRAAVQRTLPTGALNVLWAEELRWLCAKLGLNVAKRANMETMKTSIRWNVRGGDITRGVCAALRRRDCIEADPVVEDDWRPGE